MDWMKDAVLYRGVCLTSDVCGNLEAVRKSSTWISGRNRKKAWPDTWMDCQVHSKEVSMESAGVEAMRETGVVLYDIRELAVGGG